MATPSVRRFFVVVAVIAALAGCSSDSEKDKKTAAPVSSTTALGDAPVTTAPPATTLPLRKYDKFSFTFDPATAGVGNTVSVGEGVTLSGYVCIDPECLRFVAGAADGSGAMIWLTTSTDGKTYTVAAEEDLGKLPAGQRLVVGNVLDANCTPYPAIVDRTSTVVKAFTFKGIDIVSRPVAGLSLRSTCEAG